MPPSGHQGAPGPRSRTKLQEQEERVQGRPLPWEVTLLPSPHVALALLSVPGPCGALRGAGCSHRTPGSWGGGVTGSPDREAP